MSSVVLVLVYLGIGHLTAAQNQGNTKNSVLDLVIPDFKLRKTTLLTTKEKRERRDLLVELNKLSYNRYSNTM